MKKLRLIVLASAALALTSTALLVACSDDTSVDPTPSPDGGDASLSDAPVDATPQTDGGVDAADAADGNVPDSGLNLETFPKALGAAICALRAGCCYGDPTLKEGAVIPDGGAYVGDGGTYLKSTCEDQYRANGFDDSSHLEATVIAGGNVELDIDKAIDCIAKVNALSCSPTKAAFVATRDTCYAALKGKLTSGSCQDTLECAAGYFCTRDTSVDGGTGTCEPLRGAGGNCGDIALVNPDIACSSRAGGDTKRHCNFTDFGTPANWKCEAELPNGSPCFDNSWCQSASCAVNESAPSATCQGSVSMTNGAVLECHLFINPAP